MNSNSSSGFIRTSLSAGTSRLRTNLSSVAAAIALASGTAAYAEQSNVNPVSTDHSPQIAKRVDTTKDGVQTTLTAKSSASVSVNHMSDAELLKYNINFSSDPNATFVLGSEKDFAGNLSAMKQVQGVRIVKGNVEYTPSVTLDKYFKEDSTIYSGTVQNVFKGNTFLLKHFQWYLNSRLGAQDMDISGEADSSTAHKIASILKNEHITAVFTNVLESFGSEGLRMLQVGGKSAIVYTNLPGTADSQSIAVLDLPTYDETGIVSFVNAYNNGVSNLPLSTLKNITSVPGLDPNTARIVIQNWVSAVNSEVITPKYSASKTLDNIAPGGKISAVKISPTILSGNGKILSGNLREQSAIGVILQPSNMSLSYQDDISPDKINIKANLGLILEASNQGANSRVAAELIMLYGMAKTGASVYLEKGSNMEKFALSVGHKLDNGDTMKFDIASFYQYLEYSFPGITAKQRLAPKQIGTSASYTHKELDREAIVKELTGTIRLFKLESLSVGEIGNITQNINSIFQQFRIDGGIQGGKRVEGELNTAVDVMQLLNQGFSNTQVRLDIAPNVGYVRYDTLLWNAGYSEMSAGLKTKLSVLFPDQTVKGSVFVDVKTGSVYTLWAELAKKFNFGEGAVSVGFASYGNNQKPVKSIGGKFTIDNPFGLQDETSTNETSKFPSLFATSKSSKYLTYTDAERDRGLSDGYKITPKVVTQNTLEVLIDQTTFLAGDKINLDPVTKLISSLEFDNGGFAVASVAGINDARYTPFLSVVGGKLAIINFKALNQQMIADGIPAGGIKNLLVSVNDAGGLSLYSIDIVKWSVKITAQILRAFNVTPAQAAAFLAGTKTIAGINIENIDAPTQNLAPTVTQTYNSITATNNISDADAPVQNVLYSLYAADGVTLIKSKSTNIFTAADGVLPGTSYQVRTNALALNKTTNQYVLYVSPFTTITTGVTPDTTPPTTSSAPSISTAAADTTASVTQTINENGTGYYLVLPAASAAPTVAEVKAGTSFVMTAGTPAVINLSGLTPSTAYKYYFVSKDAANNDQVAVSAGLAITTTATPDTTPPTTPATLVLTGSAGSTAGYTKATGISLNVADVADPSGVQWFVSETANGVAATVPVAGDAGWSSTKPTSFTLSGTAGSRNVTVFVKDLAPTNNVQSVGKISTITLDGVTPNTPTWTTWVDTKSTAYTSRKITLSVGPSGISATGLSVTAWGAISNVSVSGGVVTFDYTTPAAPGDTITISGNSGAGTAFSTTINTPALSDPDTTLPATPSLSINTGNAYTNSTSVAIAVTGDTDNVWVTGWFVSESSSTPALGDFVAEPTTATISAGDSVKTLYVWTRDAAGNISSAGSDTITLDGVTPSAPVWTAWVTTQSTAYTSRKITLSVGASGISATGLSVTAWGAISNVSVSGGEITFDYTTPAAVGDTITISGNSGAGTAFSTTINTPALN